MEKVVFDILNQKDNRDLLGEFAFTSGNSYKRATVEGWRRDLLAVLENRETEKTNPVYLAYVAKYSAEVLFLFSKIEEWYKENPPIDEVPLWDGWKNEYSEDIDDDNEYFDNDEEENENDYIPISEEEIPLYIEKSLQGQYIEEDIYKEFLRTLVENEAHSHEVVIACIKQWQALYPQSSEIDVLMGRYLLEKQDAIKDVSIDMIESYVHSAKDKWSLSFDYHLLYIEVLLQKRQFEEVNLYIPTHFSLLPEEYTNEQYPYLLEVYQYLIENADERGKKKLLREYLMKLFQAYEIYIERNAIGLPYANFDFLAIMNNATIRLSFLRHDDLLYDMLQRRIATEEKVFYKRLLADLYLTEDEKAAPEKIEQALAIYEQLDDDVVQASCYSLLWDNYRAYLAYENAISKRIAYIANTLDDIDLTVRSSLLIRDQQLDNGGDDSTRDDQHDNQIDLPWPSDGYPVLSTDILFTSAWYHLTQVTDLSAEDREDATLFLAEHAVDLFPEDVSRATILANAYVIFKIPGNEDVTLLTKNYLVRDIIIRMYFIYNRSHTFILPLLQKLLWTLWYDVVESILYNIIHTPIQPIWPQVTISWRDGAAYQDTYVPLHAINCYQLLFDEWRLNKKIIKNIAEKITKPTFTNKRIYPKKP